MLQLRVDNAALVRLIWSLPGGGQMINVLGANPGAAKVIDQSVANALGTSIKGTFNSGTYKTHIATTVSLVAVGVRDIRQVSLPEYIDSGATIVGTAAGDALPRSVSLVVSLRTAHAGRGYRGRTYLGGFSELENDSDGTASSALVLDATTFMNAVQAAMATNGVPLAVVGRNRLARSITTSVTNTDGTVSTKVKNYPATPGHVDPVTAISIRNDTWDSQRRRTSPGSVSTLFGPLVYLDLESGEFVNRMLPKPAAKAAGRR